MSTAPRSGVGLGTAFHWSRRSAAGKPQQLAGMSAGGAAPTRADLRGLSSVPSAGPRVILASAGPSAARTQGAAPGGAKCKPEDAATRSVSAAVRSARGPAEGTHGRAAVKALANSSASLRALRVTAAQPPAAAGTLILGDGAARGAGALRRTQALYGFGRPQPLYAFAARRPIAPETAPDFPRPPLWVELATALQTTTLRPLPLASAGTSRGVPASPSHSMRPTREAGRQEEN